MRRAFFFPHAIGANLGANGLPGRVPFDVVADLVDANTVTRGAATVGADGYQRNVVGPNQDPCVFDVPFHSYCRIDSRRVDNCVKGTKKPLSHEVRPDDVIIYGKFEPKTDEPVTLVWVDTVLVVERTMSWVTSTRPKKSVCKNPRCKGKPFTYTSPSRMAGTLTGNSNPNATPAYRFNLHDAETIGSHCCSSLDDYKIIKGRTSPTAEAVRKLETTFVTLMDEHEGAPVPAFAQAADMPEHWAALQTFLESEIRRGKKAGPQGSFIAPFPDFELATALCAAIVASSGRKSNAPGTVAIPPLVPAGSVHRWSPATMTLSTAPV